MNALPLHVALLLGWLSGSLLTTTRAAEPEPPYAPHTITGRKTIGRVERLDPALDALLPSNSEIEVVAEGFDWCEGPVWNARGEALLFADVPRNVVWKWREGEGLTEFLHPSGFTGIATGVGIGPIAKPTEPPRPGESGANGLTLDNEGRLILAQHGDRQVARKARRGGFEALATNYRGKRLNSPNDVVLRSNGEVYFTDPPYGLAKGADDPRKELAFQGVYRISRRGQVMLLVQDLSRPNGLAFSPNEKLLYVAVSDPQHAVIMAYAVADDGGLTKGRVFFDATPLVAGRKGLPDGLKVDERGNLWATGPGGVLVLSPDGKHLGTLDTGEETSNCAWGGDGSMLYVTADSYLCRIKTRTHGPMPGPLPEKRR